MRLSIIIPYYNAEPYTSELLNCLAPQIRDDVEVIVVDDGSKVPFTTEYPWVRVIRQENGGVSKARNVGLDNAQGEYVSFIDADDLVSRDYVEKLTSQEYDFLEMSWKSLAGGLKCGVKLNSMLDRLPNPSVCTRAFRKAYIGDLRFNEKKDACEDEEFSRKIGYQHGKRAVVTDYTYFYRTAVEDSKSKRYLNGLCNTKRVAYYFNHVREDMQYLVNEIALEDEYNEVFILTNKCDIPELYKYAQIIKPMKFMCHDMRGEPNSYLAKREVPLRAQIIIWTRKTFLIGGIETFIYNFCVCMKDNYDIVVLYEEMHQEQIARLSAHVRLEKYNSQKMYVCDTLIVNRLADPLPKGVEFKKSVQMCHTCNFDGVGWRIPQDRDTIICVSEASKNSFGVEAQSSIVINNLMAKTDTRAALMLVSATRLDTKEKGSRRMLRLAHLLNVHKIPFVWLYFSNRRLDYAPPNMICMNSTLNIMPYLAMADYLVQLSDSESFCYSIVEALSCGTPCLCTPLDVLPEIGVVDGENSYILPFEIGDDFDIDKIDNHRLKGTFTYDYNNESRIEKWREVLGEPRPANGYRPPIHPLVKVRVKMKYMDVALRTTLMPNQELYMTEDRAVYLKHEGFVEIVD